VNVQFTVQVWIVYGALLVTVTVAPKWGGLFDGVCQAIVKVAAQAAPVSAGAGAAVTTAPVIAVADPSTAAVTRLRKRRCLLDMHAPTGTGRRRSALPV
jgi:hypothetical protein